MLVDIAAPIDSPADAGPFARQAEADGYGGLWMSEIRHDPFLGMATAATVTTTLRLGTGIALAFARNPMSTAQLAHDLQSISGGRFVLGLGSQVRAHITRRFSMPWAAPAGRMREYVLAMHAIWDCWADGDRLAFDGDYYTHTLMAPMFVPPAHGHGPPPVILAAVGDRMTEVAGEVADGLLCHSFVTERHLREATLPALERGRTAARTATAGRSARPFEIVGGPFVVTGRDEAECAAADLAVRRQIAFYASTPAYRPVLERHGWAELGTALHGLSRAGEWKQMAALIDDDVLDAFAVTGEPDRIAPQLLDRFGDIFTRVALLTPYQLHPDIHRQIATGLRDGPA